MCNWWNMCKLQIISSLSIHVSLNLFDMSTFADLELNFIIMYVIFVCSVWPLSTLSPPLSLSLSLSLSLTFNDFSCYTYTFWAVKLLISESQNIGRWGVFHVSVLCLSCEQVSYKHLFHGIQIFVSSWNDKNRNGFLLNQENWRILFNEWIIVGLP